MPNGELRRDLPAPPLAPLPLGAVPGAGPYPSVPLARGSKLDVFRAMFEPARFPAPKLDALSVAWRYVVCGLFYLTYASALIFTTETAGTGTIQSPADRPVLVPGESGPAATVDFNPADVALMPMPVVVADLLLGLLGFFLIRFRRRWPLTTYLVLTACTPIANSAALLSIWALMSLASRRDLRKIGIALAFTFTCTALSTMFLPWQARSLDPIGLPAGLLAGLMMTLVLVLIGMYHGVRQDRVAGVRDRADNADRDRELAVLGERNRIAREMHDVLAHRISLVSMHAGALAYRTDLPPEQTRAIAQIIQENAHASLSELRGVLSTLRDGQLDASGAPAAPQPTLADLPALLAEARSLGQRIVLDCSVGLDAVDQVTARHAYRIIQESLTNARKHAPHAAVDVTLSGTPGEGLAIRVENPLAPGSRAQVPGSGLGLIGVRERAALLGGRLNADPVGDRFVVEAQLPWPALS